MLRKVVFENFHATNEDIIQFIPFVHAFYAFECPLFYSDYNSEMMLQWSHLLVKVILGGHIIRFNPF